jgi:Rap1a immunity proteins
MRKVIAGISFLLLWCGEPISGASAEPPQTVADYLGACANTSKVWSDCSFAVTTIGLYDEYNMLGTRSTCPPRNSSEATTELETRSVINWLIAHPETHSLAKSDGILTALRALYPCQ